MVSERLSFTQRQRHLTAAAGRVAVVAGGLAAAPAVPRLLPGLA
jgi:hypothetical protein